MRFKFSLQRVLDVEVQMERLVDLKLATVKSELDSHRRKLAHSYQELAENQDELARSESQSLQPIQVWNSYLGFMDQTIQTQTDMVTEFEKLFQSILRQKIFHQQRIEGLEKLKETEHKKFLVEQKRDDQKKLLDVVLANSISR